MVLVGIVLGFFILRLEPAKSTEEHEGQSEQEETLIAKGPHGGRLLTQDGFEVEITHPRTRVCRRNSASMPMNRESPYPLSKYELTINTGCWGRNRSQSSFQKEEDYLRGDRVIEEPHSFDVKVSAVRESRRYDWEQTQVEGRVQLSHEALQSSGIEIIDRGPRAHQNALGATRA